MHQLVNKKNFDNIKMNGTTVKNSFVIIIILIILTKLFTWMVFGFPQSVWELDYWGGGVLIPGKNKHMSSTSRVALVST